jgi:hypothetical protein
MESIQYELVYNKLFSQLPKWKQTAIKEDSIRNNWSGVLTDFIKEVIYKAEKEFEENKDSKCKFVNDVVSNNIEKKSGETKKKVKNKKN